MHDLLQSVRKLYLAADHGGVGLKNALKARYAGRGIEVVDLGTQGEASVDYPDFAGELCRRIQAVDFSEVGILVCGSGQGMAITANKFKHIRAALCWSVESAQLSRAHNDANVLCLGQRLVPEPLAFEIADRFLSTPFDGGRHLNRVQKITSSC